MIEQKHLAVFDCDGTLVDSQQSIITCMHAAFDSENLSRPSEEEIRRTVGLPLGQAISILQPSMTPATIHILQEGYSKAWIELKQSSQLNEPLYPDVPEILDQLISQGWQLGIATGKSHRGLMHTLENHQILDRFQSFQTADRARGKPHPEMLIKAMESLGATPATTVMIGDTTFDMEMAQNAGVTAIGVTWGYHGGKELIESGADNLIHVYSDLPPFLDTLKIK